jgi:hypothetical protein
MRGQRVRVGAEAGQATAEWTGVVLVVALVLAALGALLPAGRDDGLGEALAGRITGRAVAVEVPVPGAPVGMRAPPGSLPQGRVGARGTAGPLRARRAATRARRLVAFRTLRAAGRILVRRAWIVCLGYRRFRYELKHPRLPNEPMPLEEAVEIANGCLNPYAFVGEE